MAGMFSYTKAAMERAMKVQEVILRALAKKITWWQAAEIIGISDRHMRRWRERYEEFGYDGLFDRRRGQPSPKRVPLVSAGGGCEMGGGGIRPSKATALAGSSLCDFPG
jgi:Helix-turn-helix domain